MAYWLMKSEPDCFGIDDLMNSPNRTSAWDGVRNYQARNFMRNEMRIGDLVFFYHSNCQPPGIVGIAEVASHAYPDHTAFDPNSEHPDLSSSPDNPRWYMVDIRFKEKFKQTVSLHEMKHCPALADMLLLRPGNRLSVMPVNQPHWDFINKTLRP